MHHTLHKHLKQCITLFIHKHLNVVCWERARQDGSNSHLLMSRCCFREAASRPCRAARTPPPALRALCAAADVTAEPRCADAFSATSAAQRGSSCTKNWCQQSCDTPTPCQLDEGCAPTARSVWPPLQQPGKPQPDGLIQLVSVGNDRPTLPTRNSVAAVSNNPRAAAPAVLC